MAEVVVSTVIKFKRGTKEAWNRVNPTLMQGEPGYEVDTGSLKIGDGSTAWRELSYFGGDYSISADGKSIVISEKGAELYGFAAASNGQIPSKGESGTLIWNNPNVPMTEEEILNILI